MALQRPRSGGDGEGAGDSRKPVPCRLGEGYPTLLEFLSSSRWPDGKPRIRGTMLITWSEGRFRCWLNDKDAGRSSWVSQETLSDLLASVESGLESDDLEWRKDKPKAGKHS